MEYNLIIGNLSSSTKEDWLKFDILGRKAFTYQRNVNFRIERVKNSTREDIAFDWNKFSEKKVSEETYLFYFQNSIIKEVVLLIFDGGNVVVPYPQITTNLDNMFDEIDIKIASIIDSYNETFKNVDKVTEWIYEYYKKHPL